MTVQKYPIISAAKHMLEIYEKIRLRKSISLGKKNSSRYLLQWRLKAEWDIYSNYIKSVCTSVFKGNFNKTEPVKINDTTTPPGVAASYPAGETERNRSVVTDDGTHIALIHIKRGFSRVVIIAHGFYNNKDTFLFRGIAEAFSKEYDVIVFDFRENDKSGDVFTWTAHEQKDLRAITAYAKDSRYAKIGVIGFSLGAAIALIEASCRQNIDSVIAVSAPVDLESINYHFLEKDMWEDLKLNLGMNGLEKGIRPGNPSLEKIRPFDIVDKISPTPVLFLHGEKDRLIKPKHSQLLFEKAKDPKALTIIKDGGHAERMFDVFPDQFMKICLDRFRETL